MLWMIGKQESSGRCPLCGGSLVHQQATIPFLLQGTLSVIRNVPAEVCMECDEPFLAGDATDTVAHLLSELQSLNTEVSVISFPESALDPSLDAVASVP
jgi:YgiT-type zinc finger domain-containing protein